MDAGWDEEKVYSANLDLPVDEDEQSQAGSENTEVAIENENKARMQAAFRQFIRNFADPVSGEFIYRDNLTANYEQEDYYLVIDIVHLNGFDSKLYSVLRHNPTTYVPLFEEATKKVMQNNTVPRPKLDEMPDIQLQFKNLNIHTNMRGLYANDVNNLVCVSGIVISASRASVKATELSLMCRNCKYPKKIKCDRGFGGARLPRVCETSSNARMASSDLAKCPLDPFTILGDHCTYIDQQRLKLQENPEDVPTGEMPRHINLSCDRYLVECVKPGTRITCIGIYTSYEAKSGRDKDNISDAGIRIPYIRVLGIQQENIASDFLLGKFAPRDVEEMMKLSRIDNLHEKISKSMCPAIFGSDDIKKALASMLFSGTTKHLPDGMWLRGDINVLLLGDPSCGKSQFLKFASQVAPVAVYTSGKGSSAAGLTASILRDPGTGDFQLEGGALVLADGGMVCIDEFDKMREQDRVAIHEAMEQQTISIAKAGITTILNSRTAVLAAANPTFGRYDDMKSPSENIDFQTTILSRFDLIFIIKDKLNMQRDMTIAKHVISVHKNRDASAHLEEVSIEAETLKKYIAYARSKCKPRLSETAAQLLRDRYVRFRKTMKEHRAKNQGSDAIPITVRQLEAIVRIAESLAKMELSEVATEAHVTEALRLFQVSTLSAATSDYGDGVGSESFNANIKKAEKYLSRRIPIGNKVSHARIVSELVAPGRGFDEAVAIKAIDTMVRRAKLRYHNQGKLIERVKA